MTLYPTKTDIKDEFNDTLMKSCTAGLMQIKDYHTEERKLEVRTTTPSEEIPSNYLLVSKFKLMKIV